MKKGGNNETEDVRLLDMRVLLVTLICIFMGALFILCMIFFGMQIESKHINNVNSSNTSVENVDIIGLSYEAVSKNYDPESNRTGTPILEELNGGEEKGYYVIKTKEEFDSIFSRIQNRNFKLAGEHENFTPNYDTLDVDENFFASGSVVLFSVEGRGVSNGRVSSVTRDADYGLTVEIRYSQDYASTDYTASAMFVKIPNVQPKDLEANYMLENTTKLDNAETDEANL